MEVNNKSRLVSVVCPNLLCRGVLQVPSTVRGQPVRCGCCGKDFIVPKETNKASTTKP